jgi:2-polyprenyl-3-methyl-5-hydroxy-6-metoxy-1,4-benzoquinol methylase
MGTNHDEIFEYGWNDEGAVCSHSYLLPVIDKTIRKYVAKVGNREKVSVFDAGCGNGYLARHFYECGFQTAGCDNSASGINSARTACPGGHFEVLSVYDDMAAVFGKDWDIVVSSEVIEHLYNPRLFVRRVAALLRPGGLFIVTTPYHGYVKNFVLAAAGALDRHFTALWDGGHIKFWSFKTLSVLLREQGFVHPGFHGAGRLPLLWKSMVVTSLKSL